MDMLSKVVSFLRYPPRCWLAFGHWCSPARLGDNLGVTPKPRENLEKSSETIGFWGKIMINHGIWGEIMINYGILGEIMINHGILREIMMNYGFLLTIAFDHILFACFPKVSIDGPGAFWGDPSLRTPGEIESGANHRRQWMATDRKWKPRQKLYRILGPQINWKKRFLFLGWESFSELFSFGFRTVPYHDFLRKGWSQSAQTDVLPRPY